MAQHIPTKPSSGTKVESFWYKAWFQSLWSYFNRETDVAASSTASKTLGAEFYWPVDATSGAVTITLPPANTWLGKKYLIKKTDASANAVTINRSGSDTVDGATSVSLTTRYDSILLVSDGVSAWAKVSTMGTVGGYLLAANNLSDVASRQTALNTLTAVSGATNEYVLTKDTATGNAIWKVTASGGGKLKIDVLTATASSSWNVPTGVTGVWVSGVGAGGGGGGSAAANVPGAGGGGSGERASGIFYSVTSGGTVTYQCGTKGAGATAGNNAGSDGTATTFGTISLAGGKGGQRSGGTASPAGNGGGVNGGTRGNTANPATIGQPGTAEGPTVWGGAGGGGGGSTAAAPGAAGGLCEQYAGGAGGTNDASAGGGGGGAASPYGSGGAGGNAGAAGTAAAATAYGAGGGAAGGGASGATARGGGDGADGVLYIAYVA